MAASRLPLVRTTFGLLAVFCCPVAGAATIDECEALLVSRPAAIETARCFYGLTRDETPSGPGRRNLERLSERGDLPWFSFYMGYLTWRDRPVAEGHFHRAAERFATHGEEAGESLARFQRQRFLGWLNRLDERAAELERIYALARSSERPEVGVWAGLTRATEWVRAGEDLEAAYELLRTMAIPSGMVEEEVARKERLLLLGRACLEIGKIPEARRAFDDQVELAIANGDVYGEANARYNLLTLKYEELRQAPTATLRSETEALAHAALEAAERASHPTVPLDASWVLGIVSPGEEGRRHFERCLRRIDAMGRDDSRRSLCLSSLATRLAGTEPERARRMLGEAMELAERSGDHWAELRALQESIRASWLMDPPERAIERAMEALDAIESLRDRQALGSAVQAGVFSVWSDDYSWVAGRILSEGERGGDLERPASRAFRVVERMRARALLDWLGQAVPESPGEQARRFSSLAEARRALHPDEALLSFVIAPWEDPIGDFSGGSWLLVITRDAVNVHRLMPGRVELRWDVRIFEGLVARRDGAEAGEAVRLYEDLLAEALAGLPPGIDRLILVPDDALHRLPFAALRASEDAEPLGALYELVQVPSATLWLRWREAKPEPAEQPLLVLADPQLPRDEDTEEFPLQVAQTRDAAETYDPLPWARQEGEAALRALGGGTLLVGAEASEAVLRDLGLGEFEIFHVGAHAETDEDHPERSAVRLAPSPGAAGESPDAADDPRDGYLRSAEIAHLDLDGRLVVLASCRSAGGSTLRGEGVMSLARAFFQAGAHGVVASLWPLRDDESAAMFERFYDHLGRGESVAGALRSARREAIAAGEPAAAWAGLVVLGDGSAVPLPGGRRLLDHPALPVVVPALLVLAVGLLAVLAVRRRSAAPTA